MMAKIEEVTALLVSEIQLFESSVKKLEAVQKRKIQLDLTQLHRMMSDYQQNLEKSIELQKSNLRDLQAVSRKGQRVFKGSILAVLVSVVVNLITMAMLILI